MGVIEVVPGKIYRGPQPVEKLDWKVLSALGVQTILKLNYPDEGSDDIATIFGLSVIPVPMPPKDIVGAFGKPDKTDVARAVTTLANEALQPIYVHCLHGWDRTGLVVGEYRVLYQGWDPWRQAFAEMLKFGFHPELLDLMETWAEFCESQK